MQSTIDALEVSKHNSPNDCWIVIGSRAYDVTDFLPQHPGGAGIILKYAGKDATRAYLEVHTPETAEQLLAPSTFKGLVDVKTLPNSQNESTTRPAQAVKNQVHLSLCENVDDFEAAARTTVSEYGRAYINSAADSLYSVKNNRTDWQLVTFRPRVMRNVLSLDTTTKMLGHLASSPFFIAPTGMAGLIHPEAETLLVHGAVRSGIHYCISGVSTRTPDDMMECFKDEKQKLVNQSADPAFFYQIYVNSKEEKTRQTIEKARDLGFKALVITADTPVPGKREEVNKYRAQEELNGGLREYDATREGSEDQPVRPGYDPGGLLSKTLCWDDIAWMRELFQGPIVVKGIQCAEDAKIAADLGVDGIYLSNHGGRQLDYSPSSIMILLEIRMYYPEVFEKCEVYLDGGIRRGTDIVKALCLGATSVGIGRPFLYAMGAYGTRGLLKANSILKDEFAVAMRLIGVTSIAELHPGLVNTAGLERRIVSRLRPRL